jgi:hypothetical protein
MNDQDDVVTLTEEYSFCHCIQTIWIRKSLVDSSLLKFEVKKNSLIIQLILVIILIFST